MNRLHDDSRDKPLTGRRIVWTGSENSGRSIVAALREAGARVETLPLIETFPLRPDQAGQTNLERIDMYDWVVFTSAEAVRHLPKWVSMRNARIAVVGPATKSSVEKRGDTVTTMPPVHRAAALAKHLIAHESPAAKVLFVKGDKALATLPKQLDDAGIDVDTVTVYGTRSVEKQALRRIGQILEAADGAIVASPSGVDAVSRIVAVDSRSVGHCLFFCLGRTTQTALIDAGIEAAYPTEVTPGGVVRMIVRSMSAAAGSTDS